MTHNDDIIDTTLDEIDVPVLHPIVSWALIATSVLGTAKLVTVVLERRYPEKAEKVHARRNKSESPQTEI